MPVDKKQMKLPIKEKEQPTAPCHLRLDSETKRQFKALLVLRGISMQEWFDAMVRDWLKPVEPGEKRCEKWTPEGCRYMRTPNGFPMPCDGKEDTCEYYEDPY